MDKNLFVGREYEIRQLEKYRNSNFTLFYLRFMKGRQNPDEHFWTHFLDISQCLRKNVSNSFPRSIILFGVQYSLPPSITGGSCLFPHG